MHYLQPWSKHSYKRNDLFRYAFKNYIAESCYKQFSGILSTCILGRTFTKHSSEIYAPFGVLIDFIILFLYNFYSFLLSKHRSRDLNYKVAQHYLYEHCEIDSLYLHTYFMMNTVVLSTIVCLIVRPYTTVFSSEITKL